MTVNCVELTPSIIEAESFGCEKGASTGAPSTREGKSDAAFDGTLSLDEIGELTVNLRAKLLKIVDSKKLKRLGH